jgi:Family of unknown function (DUF6152)
MKIAIAAAVLGIAYVTVAAAHHSFAMFDSTRRITVKGAVTEWQWTNPHSELFVMVNDMDGQPLAPPVVWRFESESPEVLRREFNLRRDRIQVGDNITVTAQPLRDGSKGGHMMTVTLADGTLVTRNTR